jgi:serine/threonine protein kinase
MVFEKDPLNGIPLNIEGYKSGMTGNDRRGKHELSPEPKYKKRMHGSARNLALVEALESGKMATDMCVVRRSESPWDTFVQIYECNLAGPFIVVTHRVRPSRLLGVRVIRHKDVDQLLRRFQSLQHPNLLSTLEAYVYHQSLYMVHSDICISLTEIIACGVDLDDMQLAAILAQVSLPQKAFTELTNFELLDSLLYLTEQHLRHPCLSCPNILLTATGEVKISQFSFLF